MINICCLIFWMEN